MKMDCRVSAWVENRACGHI